MITKIRKWGNGLGVRIPKSVALAGKLSAGMQVEIHYIKDGLVLTPFEKKKYQLSALLKQVTKNNLHGSIETGYE